MAWQRSIPFGYRMERAQIVCEQAEAETVKQIFSLYLNGHSLGQIAAAMTAQAVRYHAHTNQWNKNMVKRILENDRYLGNEDYPQLIGSDEFLAVRCLKNKKLQDQKPCPESIRPISRMMTCAVCGARMCRQAGKRKTTRWVCQNKGCRETAIITDDELSEALDRCFQQLATSPQLLEVCTPDTPSRSMDGIRLENELAAAFNRGTESTAYMKMLIFAAAAERYRTLPDLTVEHETRELQRQLEDRSAVIEKAVRCILLQRGAGITVELISGQSIHIGEEATQ
jgi:hypothetical protein